ncbi:hypothetical protein [Bradyrhizobium sp.]|uniref:hypothetical protein n=1 Tax=Bradyrhizobium sp. TaxID=376 RepID=UPI002610E135|nr:hypothetical protein [Bradyrhizobium sp.]
MINSDLPEQAAERLDERVDRIVAGGPRGALTLAGITTAMVIALWLAFYFFVFLPRGALQ